MPLQFKYSFYELEVVVDSDGTSLQRAVHEDTLTSFKEVVIAQETEAEGSGELFSGLPSDTGFQASFPHLGAQQIDITNEIEEQGELVADGTTNVTEIRRSNETVDGCFAQKRIVKLSKLVLQTSSNSPGAIDVVTQFRGYHDLSTIVLDTKTGGAANPNLSVSRHDSCKNDCEY